MNSIFRPKSLAVVMISSLMILVSCNQATPSAGVQAGAPARSAFVKMSGEELFSAVVFGEGDAQKILPEIWNREDVREMKSNMSADEQKKLNQDIASTIANIKKADPMFFVRFKTEIQSGDYIRVSAILQESGNYLKKMVESKGVDVDQMLSKTLKPSATSYSYSNTYNTATVTLNLGALAVAIVLFVVLIVFIPASTPTLESQGQLAKDEFVAILTNRLSGL